MPLASIVSGKVITGVKEMERGESDSGSNMAKAAMRGEAVTWASTNNLAEMVAPPDSRGNTYNLHGEEGRGEE